ncbi:MAG TPA: hypothetical protein PLR83_02995 [Pyrinomonadaceae bacterium]|mgnify:FL=1|nr:hypothetical protein [Pyrinomonadaceae bacterium]
MTDPVPDLATHSTTESLSISEAWGLVFTHPVLFIKYWNYKGAILSGVMRAPIFLITYLAARESLKLALGAAAVQFAFRFAFAGLSGALIQAFRKVEPAWKALLSVMLIVPIISHLLEFGFQSLFGYLTSTAAHTDQAIVRSICVSIFSALFALFIMRRNVLIVGEEESKSLANDVMRIPRLVFEFCAFLPNEIAAMLRRGATVTVIATLIGFTAFSQVVGWAIANRIYWTYGGGKEIWGLKYWGVDGLVLMLLSIFASSIYYEARHRRGKRS